MANKSFGGPSPNFDKVYTILQNTKDLTGSELRFLICEISKQLGSAQIVSNTEEFDAIVERYQHEHDNQLIEQLLRNETNLDSVDQSIVEKMLIHPKFAYVLAEHIKSKMTEIASHLDVSDLPDTYMHQIHTAPEISSPSPTTTQMNSSSEETSLTGDHQEKDQMDTNPADDDKEDLSKN